MSERYITTSDELTSVADAIRSKGGTSDKLAYPDGFVTAIGAISGGSTPYDEWLYKAKSIMFSSDYPDANPVVTLPPNVISLGEVFAPNNSNYETITVNFEGKVTSCSYAFCNTLNTKLKEVTLNGDLTSCGNYANMLMRNSALQAVRGTPLDFTACRTKTFAYLSNTILNNLTYIRYKPLCLNWDHRLASSVYDDESMVSIVNAFIAGPYTLMAAQAIIDRLPTIMGTVGDDGAFVLDSSGDTSMETYITSNKGWSVAVAT